jgi:mannose-6-phosphate isomerase-like protein (cupin superfamily)
MRSTFTTIGVVAICGVAAAAALAQTAVKPGHDRVPPYREPSPFMSQAAIEAALDRLDPNLVRSRTGGAVDLANGKAPGVVRRRMRGPQYAITHTRTLEYVIVTKGTGTLVTGGTLNPNATIRSEAGVKGGLPRKIGPGDVIVNLPGTPHWFSEIDEAIEYVEIQIPNVDPAPGIERAEVVK